MKRLEKLNQILNSLEFRPFDENKFTKSCLIYYKSDYGIFLVEDKNGKRYTLKAINSLLGLMPYSSGFNPSFPMIRQTDEILISLYIKEYANQIPNLLHVNEIFSGKNPKMYQLFTNSPLKDFRCKSENLNNFNHNYFTYYMTEECNYNLNYHLGVGKGTLTYLTFLAYTFGLMVGLQTLHSLGIIHNDLKASNILICDSKIAKDYTNLKYVYDDGRNKKIWTIPYIILDNRDIKIIDFGEALIYDLIIDNECEFFKNEISIALVQIINLMWKKVLDKDEQKEISYLRLIGILQKCQGGLLEAMFSPIFDVFSFSKIGENQTYIVNLLPFNNIQTPTFSGVKVLDISILMELDDRDLLNTCITNRYLNNICNTDIFWKQRLTKRFGKDYLQGKPNHLTWKKYYLQTITNLEKISISNMK